MDQGLYDWRANDVTIALLNQFSKTPMDANVFVLQPSKKPASADIFVL